LSRSRVLKTALGGRWRTNPREKQGRELLNASAGGGGGGGTIWVKRNRQKVSPQKTGEGWRLKQGECRHAEQKRAGKMRKAKQGNIATNARRNSGRERVQTARKDHKGNKKKTEGKEHMERYLNRKNLRVGNQPRGLQGDEESTETSRGQHGSGNKNEIETKRKVGAHKGLVYSRTTKIGRMGGEVMGNSEPAEIRGGASCDQAGSKYRVRQEKATNSHRRKDCAKIKIASMDTWNHRRSVEGPAPK